jgi:hypothetical protein
LNAATAAAEGWAATQRTPPTPSNSAPAKMTRNLEIARLFMA